MRWSCPIPAACLRSVAARYAGPRAIPLAGRTVAVPLVHRPTPLGQSARCENGPNGRPAKRARLEAVLFLAREPLSSRKLSQYANLADGTEARTLVRLLNRELDEAGRAFRVQEVAGGFQLTTRPKFARWLRRLDHVPSEERLSAPSMETLAVVAYRQPVMRAEIEAIRGVSCGEILNQLLSRDLVRVGGRSDELGRPYLYNTTKRFLQVFGLRSLDDLPRADLFCSASNPQLECMLLRRSRRVEWESSKQLKHTSQEDSDVSALVEREKRPYPLEASRPAKDQDPLDPRHVRMEDEDYEDDDYDDDEYEDDELEEDEELEEDDLEDDEEFEEDEVEEDELKKNRRAGRRRTGRR